MIILNFSHPLTEDQRSEIEALAAEAIAGVRDITTQLDNARPFEAQVVALLDEAGLSARQWQNEAVLINPPAYARSRPFCSRNCTAEWATFRPSFACGHAAALRGGRNHQSTAGARPGPRTAHA